MNTKDNQRSRLTRLLLKQSYLKLMQNGPASKITVRDICAGAEVNRSTFYLHFNEPNDILKELEDETIALVIGSISSIGALEDDSPDARDGVLKFLRYIQKNDELFRTLLVENSDPHFRRKLQAIALSMAENAFDIELEQEQKEYVYLYIVSGCIELLADWIKNRYPISERKMCDTLYLLSKGSLDNICK